LISSWAKHLLTLKTTALTSEMKIFFASEQTLRRVDVVLFNCPQWEIAVFSILIRSDNYWKKGRQLRATLHPAPLW
jgi:hypothetical protein